MVCKEEVFDWFKRLNSSCRIDVLCRLVEICNALEMRFIGTFLEDIARKDYHSLRESEVKANNAAFLKRTDDLANPTDRASLVVSLALLHSLNRQCAFIIFSKLMSSFKDSVLRTTMTNDAAREYLVLLTMIHNHPAFTYQEHQDMFKAFHEVEESLNRHIDLSESGQTKYMEDPDYPFQQSCSKTFPPTSSDSATGGMRVEEIKVNEITKRSTDRKFVYNLEVKYSNGDDTCIFKSYQDIKEFHRKLDGKFKGVMTEIRLPTGDLGLRSHEEDKARQLKPDIIEFFRHWSNLSSEVRGCDIVLEFVGLQTARGSLDSSRSSFTPPQHQPLNASSPNPQHQPFNASSPNPQHQPASSPKLDPSNSRVESPMISTMNRVATRAIVTHSRQALPVTSVPNVTASPLASPLASTFETNRPSDYRHPRSNEEIRTLFQRLGLVKYYPRLSHLSLAELLNLTDQDYEKLGIPQATRVKLMKELPTLSKPGGEPVMLLGAENGLLSVDMSRLNLQRSRHEDNPPTSIAAYPPQGAAMMDPSCRMPFLGFPNQQMMRPGLVPIMPLVYPQHPGPAGFMPPPNMSHSQSHQSTRDDSVDSGSCANDSDLSSSRANSPPQNRAKPSQHQPPTQPPHRIVGGSVAVEADSSMSNGNAPVCVPPRLSHARRGRGGSAAISSRVSDQRIPEQTNSGYLSDPTPNMSNNSTHNAPHNAAHNPGHNPNQPLLHQAMVHNWFPVYMRHPPPHEAEQSSSRPSSKASSIEKANGVAVEGGSPRPEHLPDTHHMPVDQPVILPTPNNGVIYPPPYPNGISQYNIIGPMLRMTHPNAHPHMYSHAPMRHPNQHPNQSHLPPVAHVPPTKPPSCCNCGQPGHYPAQCPEPIPSSKSNTYRMQLNTQTDSD